MTPAVYRLRRPPRTLPSRPSGSFSTSSAHTDGQSCGQTEGWNSLIGAGLTASVRDDVHDVVANPVAQPPAPLAGYRAVRRSHVRSKAAMCRPLSLLTLVLGLTLAGAAAAQQDRAAIVDEAVRAAEQAQAADKERVKRMSEQAAAAANAAPSGTEAVGSAAPPATTAPPPAPPLPQPAPAPKLSLRDLLDRQVRDRNGEPVGQVRDVVVDAAGTGALVLVETGDGQAKAVNAARLLAAPDKADGFRVDLDRTGIAALPTFRREGEAWRMAE